MTLWPSQTTTENLPVRSIVLRGVLGRAATVVRGLFLSPFCFLFENARGEQPWRANASQRIALLRLSVQSALSSCQVPWPTASKFLASEPGGDSYVERRDPHA